MTSAVFDPLVSPNDRPRSRSLGDRSLFVSVFLCSHRIHECSCIPIKTMHSIILKLLTCIFHYFVQWTNQPNNIQSDSIYTGPT
jgi:hypothetical protein